VALLAGAVCLPLLSLDFSKFVALMVIGLAYGAVYLGLLFSFKLLRPEDKTILKRWITLQALRPQRKEENES
jgi:hypothetical protein